MLNEISRLDTLLALALLHSSEPEICLPGDAANSDKSLESRVCASLSELSAADQRLLEGRAAWYAKLAHEEQTRWLSVVLTSARMAHRQGTLDEHIHASHIVEALRNELPSTKGLVLQYLPRALAEQVVLELEPQQVGKDYSLHDAEELAVKQPDADGDTSNQVSSKDYQQSKLSVKDCPSEDMVEIVRQGFLANFVTSEMLPETTTLDLLSSVELIRLIKIIGEREIAVACQGNATVEAVTAFLRRFTPVDARLIVKQIKTVTNVSSERIALAEQLVGKACDTEIKADRVPKQIINRVGLSLLALSAAQRPQVAVDYTLQKLPVSIANKIRELIAEGNNAPSSGLLNIVAAEIEVLAAAMRRAVT